MKQLYYAIAEAIIRSNDPANIGESTAEMLNYPAGRDKIRRAIAKASQHPEIVAQVENLANLWANISIHELNT